MEQWITWIPEVGFPILVTFYLLHRIDHRLKELRIFTSATTESWHV